MGGTKAANRCPVQRFVLACNVRGVRRKQITLAASQPPPPSKSHIGEPAPMALCDTRVGGCGEHLPAWGLRGDRIPGTDQAVRGGRHGQKLHSGCPPRGRGMPAAVRMPAVVRMPACHSRRFKGKRPPQANRANHPRPCANPPPPPHSAQRLSHNTGLLLSTGPMGPAKGLARTASRATTCGPYNALMPSVVQFHVHYISQFGASVPSLR